MLDSSALILHFAGPRTVTGEDILELHVHGGPAIVKAVLAAIPQCSSAETGIIRYAEPGEFTRRAFMNGRFDLTQVEALGDVLAADTEQQRRQSIRGTTGTLARHYEAWRQQLLEARGELEALIDFSEDQHFDESQSELTASVARQIEALQASLTLHSQNAVRGELLRHGISVSLLGAPNAGKSSLLNRIVGREAAIVSNEAGTTRDVVEIGLDLGGYFCRFGDTAGLRKAVEAEFSGDRSIGNISRIEQEGMRRAKARADESDLVVVVLSFEQTQSGGVALRLDPEVCEMAERFANEERKVAIVVNKADLLTQKTMSYDEALQQIHTKIPSLRPRSTHFVSCLHENGEGVGKFLDSLIQEFTDMTAALTLDHAAGPEGADQSMWQESLGASERHRNLLNECVTHLEAFMLEAQSGPESDSEADIVLAAEHLRWAADCLAKITGRGEAGDVEEILGVVFQKFCVGK